MGQKFGSDSVKPLQYSAPNVILTSGSRVTIGGQQYLISSNLQVALSGLTANTLYFVYAQASGGVVSLTYLTSAPSVNLNKKLVGAFYSNGMSPVAFGSFINIEGTPESEWWQFIVTITGQGSATTTSVIGKMRRRGFNANVSYEIAWNAAGSGTNIVEFSFPLTKDLTKLFSGSSSYYPVGNMGGSSDAGVQGQHCNHFPEHNSSNSFMLLAVGGVSHLQGQNIPATSTWGFYVDHCPISGWSNTPLKDL